MATLQKFKLLATQCGVAQSPTRSPGTSPVVMFRRRKTTLRMLLSRSCSRRSPPRKQEWPIQEQRLVSDLTEKKESRKEMVGRSLKDLFVSSPPYGDDEKRKCEVFAARLNGARVDGGLGNELKRVVGSPRPVWVGYRHRLLKRAWRPMLGSIPE